MTSRYARDPFLRRGRYVIPFIVAAAALSACVQAGPSKPHTGEPIDVKAEEALFEDAKGERLCGEIDHAVDDVQPLNRVNLRTLGTIGIAHELDRDDLRLDAATCAGRNTVWVISTNSMILH